MNSPACCDDGCGVFGVEFEVFGEIGGGLFEAFDVRVVFEHGRRGDFVADLQGYAAFELEGDFVVEVEIRVPGEDGFDGFADEGVDEFVFGVVAFGEHELELAAGAGGDEGEVASDPARSNDAFFSLRRMPRRSADETTFSALAMEQRTETPEDWLMWGLGGGPGGRILRGFRGCRWG